MRNYPTQNSTLVNDAITSVRDDERWAHAVIQESSAKTRLGAVASSWPEIDAWLDGRT